MTFGALRLLSPHVPMNLFFLDLAPHVAFAQGREAIARIADRAHVGIMPVSLASGLDDLRPVRRLPLVLAGLLGLAAAAALGHALVTSIRRRRRDLAVLKTLGFVRRQVSATVAWQATTLAVIALVLGVPLGIAAGRWAWTLFASQIGVASEPAVGVVAVLLVVPATALVANLVAAIPGRLAARTQPALVLRSE